MRFLEQSRELVSRPKTGTRSRWVLLCLKPWEREPPLYRDCQCLCTMSSCMPPWSNFSPRGWLLRTPRCSKLLYSSVVAKVKATFLLDSDLSIGQYRPRIRRIGDDRHWQGTNGKRASYLQSSPAWDRRITTVFEVNPSGKDYSTALYLSAINTHQW